MMNNLTSLRNRLEQRKGRRDQLLQSKGAIEQVIRQDRRGLSRHENALEIAKQVGLKTQQQLEFHLAEQVSLAMEAVFDDPYKLAVRFVEKRGKTEVELLFSRRGLEFPPIGSAGGGAIDIASFALRIAYWTMRQDQKIRPLILADEPFSQLKGVETNRRALAIVQEISQKLGVQIISVSDERMPRRDILACADRVFEVTQEKRSGKSSVIIAAEGE